MRHSNSASRFPGRHDALTALALGLALTASSLACADDTPTAAVQAQQQDDWNKVMELGKIDVKASKDEQARHIVAGFKVIKRALKANLSYDPADANTVVCRMNYDTGSHLTAHLMCSTNRAIMVYTDSLHAQQLVHEYGNPDAGIEQLLEHMNGSVTRTRYFSSSINASELQKLLLQVQCDGCSNRGLVVGNN